MSQGQDILIFVKISHKGENTKEQAGAELGQAQYKIG